MPLFINKKSNDSKASARSSPTPCDTCARKRDGARNDLRNYLFTSTHRDVCWCSCACGSCAVRPSASTRFTFCYENDQKNNNHYVSGLLSHSDSNTRFYIIAVIDRYYSKSITNRKKNNQKAKKRPTITHSDSKFYFRFRCQRRQQQQQRTRINR